MTAVPGSYLLTAKAATGDVELPNQVIVLFNPWHPNDGCYFDQAEELDEYLLNDSGNIWVC